MKRFVLVDRDGTINVDKHYLADPEGLELIPGAAEGLRRLQELGFGIVVVTNQSGIGRGYFGMQQLDAIHIRLSAMLAAYGIIIDGIYICPHGPEDDCGCRKPLPGMVEQAVAEHGFDPRESFVIGDKRADVELGKAVGAVSILVRTGKGAGEETTGNAQAADYIVDDLLEAAILIENLIKRG